LGLLAALPAVAQNSAGRKAIRSTFEDSKNHTVVSVITSVGNAAYEMKVNGTNVLCFPFATIDVIRQRDARSVELQDRRAAHLLSPNRGGWHSGIDNKWLQSTV